MIGRFASASRRLAALGLTASLLAGGCAGKSARGELGAPADATEWDSRLGLVFDDRYTAVPVELTGRAPIDVMDQRRFSQRMGYADLVVLVTVDQVWSRGLHGGDPQQRLDVTLGEVLLGELPKGTELAQVLRIRGNAQADPLPAALIGQVMLLFVRWAPGERPAYHHHVMPADAEAVDWIQSMVRHARAEGKLPSEGAKSRASRRAQRKAARAARAG
ncbi:MAG: hypothetical protein JNL82_28790 [Myxococcales bacterium]|nr:hypothetical protein [Myxococcales bacterium]